MASLHDARQAFDHRAYLYTTERPHDHDRILAAIARCSDGSKLRQWILNANRRDAPDVRNAAFRRIGEISRKGSQDNIDNAARRVLATYQTRLTIGRCYKVKMRKFQDLLRQAGGADLLNDLIRRRKYRQISQSLVDLDLGDLTVEAAVLRFPAYFDAAVQKKARAQLKAYGFTGRINAKKSM